MVLSYSRVFLALFVFSLFGAVVFASGPDDGLDEFSQMCLRCHSAPVSLDPHKTGGRLGAGQWHIVGLDYADRAKADPTLTPPDALNGALKLVGGRRISCITCHVAYVSKSKHVKLSQERKKRAKLAKDFFDPMLVLDNSQSALCRKCHKK